MKRRLLVAGAAALVASAPAAAQLSTSRSGVPGVREASLDEFYWSMRQLGDCLAERKPADSRALVTSAIGSATEQRLSKALVGRGTSCLRHLSRMGTSTDMLRGAIAEGLYAREVSTPPAPRPAPAPLGLPAGLGAAHMAMLIPRTRLADFARCYASAHPAAVHDLLATTRLGDDKERAAIARMAADFGPCLPADVEVSIDPPSVRLALAEALYRNASMPAGVQAVVNGGQVAK